jgi:hypothetical protein
VVAAVVFAVADAFTIVLAPLLSFRSEAKESAFAFAFAFVSALRISVGLQPHEPQAHPKGGFSL